MVVPTATGIASSTAVTIIQRRPATGSGTPGGSVEHLLKQVRVDLASMPINQFREKYRLLAE
ncbi:MAG: hypothetical protein AVDCRST_MAG57-1740 [uncultured Blastococcus sp.]|uniref:Uncharacterized protein n=1 Tax=uncultured Blastococcus sp. TaxID=217144 RepID=A0A6J4IBM5_9ACTN|nr:MAG: hypothetical protein AVDCRST_MAG57-1740 [uncultured Blastococcus sp.]